MVMVAIKILPQRMEKEESVSSFSQEQDYGQMSWGLVFTQLTQEGPGIAFPSASYFIPANLAQCHLKT